MSIVLIVAPEAPSTARTKEANARSASPVCRAYSQGLPNLPGTLTADVLTQFSEELCVFIPDNEKKRGWARRDMCTWQKLEHKPMVARQSLTNEGKQVLIFIFNFLPAAFAQHVQPSTRAYGRRKSQCIKSTAIDLRKSRRHRPRMPRQPKSEKCVLGGGQPPLYTAVALCVKILRHTCTQATSHPGPAPAGHKSLSCIR